MSEPADLNDLSTYWRDYKKQIEYELFTLVRLGKIVGAEVGTIYYALDILTKIDEDSSKFNTLRRSRLKVLRDALWLKNFKKSKPEKALDLWRLWIKETHDPTLKQNLRKELEELEYKYDNP